MSTPSPGPQSPGPHPVELPAGGLAEAVNDEQRAGLIEAGRLLFARPCTFFYASQAINQLPPMGAPEVAFCGRSNVGKSSLLNALTGQKALARVSVTPGRTRQLNFFTCDEGRLTLVDMPGYGYAKAAKTLKADWQGLMFDFLRGRPVLRRVLLLMDARVETKPADRAALDLLSDAAVAFQIVITKADDVKKAQLEKRITEIEAIVKKRTAAHPLVLITSSETGQGIPELRAELATLAG
ncbi:YihA family ribosome biogenesis GTP-binding protein [Roseomonas frigidaquae]|uniref:Probable GTP-binding protein EngB n=1 Tax=Falsiroseomonas frigidaquae TaxID=487318 RepID=A0ABX1F766_9PROT|nr:ribosome biogenesis GTP-binding protein YihA/YsxC [Falsiroseomonas frigidaquae]NKE48228.1 YihA family ribosome biogenesis GTP-binding protein [Falsiroseomonas frigidaquae]